MHLIAVGTNHRHSPIELRERIYFTRQRLPDALRLLKAEGVFCAAVILSTCNRVEIYANAEEAARGREGLIDFISRYQELPKDRLLPYLYIYEGEEALAHLFSVACGLDSLILGDSQIAAQAEEAFLESKRAGFTDRLLEEAFDYAVCFAKTAHSRGVIPAGISSAGKAAVSFIRNKFGSISGKNILIIGAGRVVESLAGDLKEEAPRLVFISNRNFAKAKRLADEIGARAVRLGELSHLLNKVDIVFSATSSPHFIIRREDLAGVAGQRLLIIDLALPRDVDPGIKGMENVDLYTLEELFPLLDENITGKKQETERAEKLVKAESERIWLKFTGSVRAPALLP